MLNQDHISYLQRGAFSSRRRLWQVRRKHDVLDVLRCLGRG